MKFTKLTLIAMLLALLVCAFAACGDEPVETEGTGNETVGDSQTTEAPESDAAPESTPATEGETEHVHTPVEQIEEPTCSERGYKREVCSECEEQLSVKPIDMIDHVEAAPATCTEGSVCKFCGTAMAAPAGHQMGAVVDSKPATTTEAGYEKATCTVCGLEVTTLIPAGITENFNNIAAGALSKDVMAESSALAANFTFDGFQDGGFEIAEENGGHYVKKNAANAQMKFNNTDILNSDKLEFTFDFRLDAEQKSTKGLLSLVSGKKEMRILNINSNALYFGINDNGIVCVAGLEVGKWTKVRVTLDTTTMNYEIYVDGAKCLYTAKRADDSGRYDCYVLQEDGTYAVVAAKNDDTLHNGSDRSPFYPAGDEFTQFYFFHWSEGLACSLDNLTVGFANAQ